MSTIGEPKPPPRPGPSFLPRGGGDKPTTPLDRLQPSVPLPHPGYETGAICLGRCEQPNWRLTARRSRRLRYAAPMAGVASRAEWHARSTIRHVVPPSCHLARFSRLAPLSGVRLNGGMPVALESTPRVARASEALRYRSMGQHFPLVLLRLPLQWVLSTVPPVTALLSPPVGAELSPTDCSFRRTADERLEIGTVVAFRPRASPTTKTPTSVVPSLS